MTASLAHWSEGPGRVVRPTRKGTGASRKDLNFCGRQVTVCSQWGADHAVVVEGQQQSAEAEDNGGE